MSDLRPGEIDLGLGHPVLSPDVDNEPSRNPSIRKRAGDDAQVYLKDEYLLRGMTETGRRLTLDPSPEIIRKFADRAMTAEDFGGFTNTDLLNYTEVFTDNCKFIGYPPRRDS